MKKDKHKKIPEVPVIVKILNQRLSIAFLLSLICLAALPLRMQNMKLDGYISDDAWWHYRQIKEVAEFGHRLNPDIYEFATLSRPMTYPPLFHYTVAFLYKFLGKGISLVRFTNYYNLFEAALYILLIYGISYLISGDKLFSLVGAVASAVSYGIIIRARSGELMPFVLGDLFALASVIFIVYVLRNPVDKKAGWFCAVSGVLMGLSILSWNGGVFIYLPLILFALLAAFIARPPAWKAALKNFLLCFFVLLVVCLPWYLPFLMKYGINPHSQEMQWFMKGFTVLHQVKPFNFYILTSGTAIFFIPVVLISLFFRRSAADIFFGFWILLGAIATYTGWRGYVAVVPVISAIAISIGISRLVYFFVKHDSRYVPVIFVTACLLFFYMGCYISSLRLAPLEQNNPNEVRTNQESITMLKHLKEKYPKAITIDHITWMSEDAAVGDLRMTAGQYLEYLPKGSSEALKDVSYAYLSDEDNAHKIFNKYSAELIIVRKQLLQLPQLSLLFAPPELRSEDYLSVVQEGRGGPQQQITINFTPKGMQTMLFRMLNRQNLQKFELVYASHLDKNDPLPFVVVYRLKK